MRQTDVVMSISNIRKSYRAPGYKVEALKSVSFDLHKGEFIAVMGTSGSGKSTLLNILGALDNPDEGSMVVKGIKNANIFNEPDATFFRGENIGFIFQSYNLLKDLTVEENIALPLILKDVKAHEIEKLVSRMLALIGLEKWRRHRPVQLSGGQQQRVAIGRALITSPPIILADEPTGNLDFNTSNEILHVLLDLKEKLNQSIILVTHDPQVAAFADRVLFFHDGDIVDEHICIDKDKDMESILLKFKHTMRPKP